MICFSTQHQSPVLPPSIQQPWIPIMLWYILNHAQQSLCANRRAQAAGFGWTSRLLAWMRWGILESLPAETSWYSGYSTQVGLLIIFYFHLIVDIIWATCPLCMPESKQTTWLSFWAGWKTVALQKDITKHIQDVFILLKFLLISSVYSFKSCAFISNASSSSGQMGSSTFLQTLSVLLKRTSVDRQGSPLSIGWTQIIQRAEMYFFSLF